MKAWTHQFGRELRTTVGALGGSHPAPGRAGEKSRNPWWLWPAAALPLVGTMIAVAIHQPHFLVTEHIPDLQPATRFANLTHPVREAPRRFRANTHLPTYGEGKASGSMGYYPFMPKHDLIHIQDGRVWWESEHDVNDTEDDHIIHRSMEEPLRRLIELVDQEGAVLKIQDAYRDEGIHAVRSLHKEGRAVDLTSEGISLEKLSKLAWAAGFDWVYNEAPKRGGAHVHASVRAVRPASKPRQLADTDSP